MIDPHRVAYVKLLLAEGELSQRTIGRLTGISRGTVGAIALGKRRDRPPKDDLSLGVDQSRPAERCTGCGGKVYKPCQLCRARSAMAKGRRRFTQSDDVDEADSSLQLRDVEHERYEEIHQKKKQPAKTSRTSGKSRAKTKSKTLTSSKRPEPVKVQGSRSKGFRTPNPDPRLHVRAGGR